MLFQMCPQVTEKGLNLSKFQFLHALKNVLLLFFFLHGKQFLSQILHFYFPDFFSVANTKGKNTNRFSVNESPSCSHLLDHLLQGYINGSILKMLTAINTLKVKK